MACWPPWPAPATLFQMAFSERRIPIGDMKKLSLVNLPDPVPTTGKITLRRLTTLPYAFSGAVGTNFKVLTGADQSSVWVTLLAVEDLPAIAPVNPASFAVPTSARLRACQQRFCLVVWRIVSRATGYSFV